MTLPECFDCKYGGEPHPCRNADGTYDFRKVATALVERGRLFGVDGSEPDATMLDETAWVTDCEFDLVEDHPKLIVPLTLAAINACETPEDAAYVAAGLLETALSKHGPAMIGDIEQLAARSAKVRYTLSGVWSHGGSIDAEVWKRLGQAIGSGPRMSDDGRSSYDGSEFTVLDEAQAKALMRERVGDDAASTP